MSVTRPNARADFNASLNGYRGLCALLVFVFHCGSVGILPWPSGSALTAAITWLWSACKYGVEMFFMISGFVILGSLLRHATLSGFLQDRWVRIFAAWVPTLIIVTLVCSVLQLRAFADATPLQAVGIFAANLLLLPPIVPIPMIHLVSWSLSYEWVFYLTAALAVLLKQHYPQATWATALWGSLAVVFICLFPRALFFVTGVLVFQYRTWFAAHRAWLRWPLLSLLVFLVAWQFTGVEAAHLTRTVADFVRDGSWIAALVAFVAALHMFAGICLNVSKQTRWLNGPTFQFLGTISYSFYLWHSLVMAFAKRAVNTYIVPQFGAAVGFTVFVVGSLLISLPVAWLSWKLLEVRLAAVLRRMWTRKPVIAGAVSVP